MIKPLNKNIVAEGIDSEVKTSFGLIIPDSVEKEKPVVAKVIAIGVEVDSVGVGDTIIFSRYSPIEIEIESKKYLILHESDVIGKTI